MHCAQQSRTDRSSADSATCVRRLQVVVAVFALFAADLALAGGTYYVATNGSDDNSGSVDNPFGTFDHAIRVATPGDTICVRGGTYMLDHRLLIDKAGTSDSPINLWAMPGEIPILDFSSNPLPPPQPRDGDVGTVNEAVGIHIGSRGHWWHLKGLTIQNAPYYGVRIYGSHNTLEQLTMRYNKASGLEITGKEGLIPSYNLVLNCDSYLNFDPQSNGEDADGFAAKFDTLGPGNVFRGLRAWSNSDDGFDFWHASPGVLLEDCWSFDNGFKRPQWATQVTGSWRGDGLGFKLGASAGQLILNRVAAWGNKAFGIDENGNGDPNGVIIRNATLVNNAKDGNPVQISLDDGKPHTVTNTIAFDVDGGGVTGFEGPVSHAFNTWNGIGVSAADFESLDMDLLFAAATAPRSNDGSLPKIGLRLAAGSHLIDAGTNVGLPYIGAAPDLGAFEAPEPDEHEFTYPGAIAYWKMDETAGDIACDSIGVYDGVLNGVPTWKPTGGRIGGALELDGIADYVSTPVVLNPAVGAFSVFAWIKGGVPGQVILSQTGGVNWLLADPSEGKLMTSLSHPARRLVPPPLVSESIIVDGIWHRVGFVWDGSHRTLYVDDTEVAKDAKAQPGLAGSDGGLHIGAGKDLDAGSFWFGLIDDVRIYNRAAKP